MRHSFILLCCSLILGGLLWACDDETSNESSADSDAPSDQTSSNEELSPDVPPSPDMQDDAPDDTEKDAPTDTGPGEGDSQDSDSQDSDSQEGDSQEGDTDEGDTENADSDVDAGDSEPSMCEPEAPPEIPAEPDPVSANDEAAVVVALAAITPEGWPRRLVSSSPLERAPMLTGVITAEVDLTIDIEAFDIPWESAEPRDPQIEAATFRIAGGTLSGVSISSDGQALTVAAGTMFRLQPVTDTSPFSVPGTEHKIVVQPPPLGECEGAELLCEGNGLCYEPGVDHCVLCEGRSQAECVCRDDAGQLLPDDRECQYDTSPDTVEFGACDCGVCLTDP